MPNLTHYLARVPDHRNMGAWELLRTDHGHPFYAWKWNMARISDDLLDCVIYLYPSVEAAKKGEAAGGTGFLLAMRSKVVPSAMYVYAVTNSHVIREAGSPVARLNTAAGATDVIPFTANHWIHHPDGDDLAVAILPSVHQTTFKYKLVPEDFLISKEDVARLNMGPGEGVVMVGRFVSHEGRQRNLPIARFGNISMMPWEPVLHQRGILQESFLVEMRSLGGFSGSPVFSFPSYERGAIVVMPPPKSWLLGVDWAHLPITDKVLERDEQTPVKEGWVVKSNSGQAAVVPAWRLRDFLYCEALVRQREEDEQVMREDLRRAAISDAVSQTPRPGPEPEHLAIEGDWEDAVKRTLQRGKPPKDMR